MKRQNSTTSEDDHSRASIDSMMMSSPPAMSTPPYNRNSIGSHGGRRRKKLSSYSNSNSSSAEKRSMSDDRNNRTQTTHSRQMNHHQPLLLSSPGGIGGSMMSAVNSPTTSTTHHDALHNTPSSSTTTAAAANIGTPKNNPIFHINNQEDEEDTSKKTRRKAPPQHPTNHPLFHLLTTLHYKLTTKLHYYRKKLSTLSPRQKVVLCTLIIVWKFLQAWLIVKGVVWLSGGSSSSGGSGITAGKGVGVVHVGQSMEQRLKLEEELKLEIELSSRVAQEDSTMLEEERLWMDHNREDEVGRGGEDNDDGGGEEEWIEEEEESDVHGRKKRILYMLTVTCSSSTQQEQQQLSSLHAANESSSSTHQQQQQQRQRRDGITATNNKNDNSSRNLDSISRDDDTTATNIIDSILSTLSTNVQTMIDHPEGYTVDVYWIMGCAWSEYFGNSSMQSSLSSSVTDDVGEEQQQQQQLDEKRLDSVEEKVSEYWNDYIARQLPDGVGLQVWEDAMPLDYYYSPKIHNVVVGNTSRQNRGKDELDNFLASRGIGGGGGGGGTRGLSRANPQQQGQTQQQQVQDHRRLEEEESKTSAAVRIVNVIHHQGQKTSHLHSQFKTVTKNGDQDHRSATTLSPSIDKFMKQHRYVARDKLDYYDVFLSFGASLQQYQSQPSSNSITRPSGEELVTVNGTSIEFCTRNLYRDTKISCSDRVDYLMKRYGIAKNVAMVNLLKEKDCICTVDEGRGGALEVIIPSQSLERITGDHIHTFLSMSSELNELPNGQHIIPGLVSVDAVPSIAAESINKSGTQQLRVDASPCCGSDSMELTVEMKGGASVNADEWQMMKVETANSADGEKDKAEVEAQQPLPSPFEWIAVERRSGGATTSPTFKFYKDGWMLTKDQLLRLDYGSNRGKFLPPFTNDNIVHNNSIHRQGLASPLFDSADDGGLRFHRAISLDPNRFSRQLIRHPGSRPASKNAPLGVKELLRLFHKAKDEM